MTELSEKDLENIAGAGSAEQKYDVDCPAKNGLGASHMKAMPLEKANEFSAKMKGLGKDCTITPHVG